MKNYLFTFLVSVLAFLASCTNHQPGNSTAIKKTADSGVRKKANEEVVISFRLVQSDKIAMLCRDKENKYLVYRFGTADHTELEFPSALDSASWKHFKYSGYARAGGIENEGLTAYSVSFKNNGVLYKIYQDSHSEDNSQEVGILITLKNKETKLTGNVKSVQGALSLLNDNDDLIANSYASDQK